MLKIALHGNPRHSDSARLCYEGGGIYEYVQNGVDKGAAAKALCEKLRIDPADTAALGDGENDISMIRMAGFGVAMENAGESVKLVADHITVTNNDAGVAAAIRKFVL